MANWELRGTGAFRYPGLVAAGYASPMNLSRRSGLGQAGAPAPAPWAIRLERSRRPVRASGEADEPIRKAFADDPLTEED